MAGDWIAWQVGLTKKPEVVAIGRRLGLDRRMVAATCMEVWEWADQHTVDGYIDGVDPAFIDDLVGIEGFGQAMSETKPKAWLERDNGGLLIPNFGRWNGETAKARLQKNQRQARWRRQNRDAE